MEIATDRNEDWVLVEDSPVELTDDETQNSDTIMNSSKTNEETMENTDLHPVIAAFKIMIEEDSYIYMLFHKMFEEIPNYPPYTTDPSGKSQIRDYNALLLALNAIIHRAPTFNKANAIGAMVEMPIAYLLEWPMGTPSGNTLFHHPTVNVHLRALLNTWAHFLSSPASTHTLTSTSPTGWFSADALAAQPNFTTDFVCDPSAPHHGFTSWEAFFTRRYRPGVRPIASPYDDAVIANPCEAAPLRLAHDVKGRDTFWLKAQPHSLQHMLAGDALAAQFVGGSIYQANLGSLNYHRWHSPVAGTVVKAYVIPGAYYAESREEGFDAEGPIASSAYITHVNTRAVVFVRARDERIGIVGFLAVGVQEFGSCEVGVREGQGVVKGEEMGMFHFGGSSVCLLLGRGVDVEWDLYGERPGLEAENLRVGDAIARVRGAGKGFE